MPTETNIKTYIAETLGAGVIDFELSSAQVTNAVTRAKQWYAMLIGQTKTVFVSIASGITEYTMPDDCDAVVAVAPDATNQNAAWGWPLSTFNFSQMIPQVGRGSLALADVTQALMYFEQVQRTAGADPDWYYDEGLRKLIVTPMNQQSGRVRVWYQTNEIDVTKIKLSEFGLVQDYALACAMETLSNIRTMYSEIPSAQGGTTLNGELLNANAIELKRSCTEQLRALQPPAPFITG